MQLPFRWYIRYSMGSAIKRKKTQSTEIQPQRTKAKLSRQTMEVSKVLMTAMLVALLHSVTLSAPLKRSPSTINVLVNVIYGEVKNATQETKNLYQLVTSTKDIEDPLLMLPNMNTESCSSQQSDVDKLALAYKKLFIFRNPLYMAYSYEENQGSQHKLLAQALRYTSYYVNGSTVVLNRMMRQKHFTPPTVSAGMSEADLDQYCRGYLQGLVDNNLVQLVITNDIVKIFRNYLTLTLLNDVIGQVSSCVVDI